MTKYENQILIASTLSEFPVHGYQIGQLLYYTFDNRLYQLVARNTHKWIPIQSPANWKEGKCDFNSASVLRGEGILTDLVSIGTTPAFNGIDGNGNSIGFGTGPSGRANGGIGILRPVTSDGNGFTRNTFLPYYLLKCIIPSRSSNDTAFYSGFIKNATGPALSDTPIANTEGGIMVGFGGADNEWFVFHSNGDGSTAPSKTALTPSLSVATAITGYRIEMIHTTATDIIVNVYNSNHNILGTATINTNVLPNGKSINWMTCVQNVTGSVNKTLSCNFLQARTTA